MASKENGINMLDVKKNNRGSILSLAYHSGGVSRKDMAQALGLTPAAITLITTDLIDEGILVVDQSGGGEPSAKRKGRKEVSLRINAERYAVVGVYLSKNRFRVICIDLANTVLFEDTVYIANYGGQSALILQKIAAVIQSHLTEYSILSGRTLLGVGVSVNGIVDARQGVSVNSYHIWENNVPVTETLEELLAVPVVLTNNICSLALGENYLSHSRRTDDMLFIKYGPGVGAARFVKGSTSRVSDYNAIQLGHTILEPNGSPCICGNQGCLETIVSYDSIKDSIARLANPVNAPHLCQGMAGNPDDITIGQILQAYDAGDKLVHQALTRTIHSLCLAVRNALTLFDPEIVVLYGEMFENTTFREAMRAELAAYTNTSRVTFSGFNLQLETFGPAATVISLFFENGGMLVRCEPEERNSPSQSTIE